MQLSVKSAAPASAPPSDRACCTITVMFWDTWTFTTWCLQTWCSRTVNSSWAASAAPRIPSCRSRVRRYLLKNIDALFQLELEFSYRLAKNISASKFQMLDKTIAKYVSKLVTIVISIFTKIKWLGFLFSLKKRRKGAGVKWGGILMISVLL